MDRESKIIIRRVFIDLIILLCVGMPILLLYLWGKPYERGFFCDDESLRHPYKESTVTSLMLYLGGLFIPITTIFVTEYCRMRNHKAAKSRQCLGKEIPPWLWESYKVIGIFLFGTACQQLTTDIAKYSIGRLRPHFFAICDPNIDCSLDENQNKYIENFTCQGTANAKLLKEVRLSFPSGHSSFSAYAMIFFALYLHRRFTWSGSRLLRHGLQFVVVMLTWYTVLSRVSDYKHHWSDVMAGFFIGLTYAVIIFAFASDLRKPVKVTRKRSIYDSEMHTTNNGATRHV